MENRSLIAVFRWNCLFSLFYLSARTVAEPYLRDAFDYQLGSRDTFHNVTEINPLLETLAPMARPQTNGLPFANLFRRQDTPACWTATTDGQPKYCSPNRCCIDPNNEFNGWCCGTAVACGGYSGTDYCTVPVVTVTATTTSTVESTSYSTEYTTIDASTISTTVTTTEFTVVTVSNVKTQTDVVYVTETAGPARRLVREEHDDFRATTALRPTLQLPASTAPPMATPISTNEQPTPPPPRTTTSAVNHARAWERREISSSTTTSWIVVTEFLTAGNVYTSTVYNTPTSTFTYTITSTFTSAPNAETTISVTSTITKEAEVTDNPTQNSGDVRTTATSSRDPATTSAAAAGRGKNGGGGGSIGLSTGAKAGIGAGVGGGVLIAAILLALLWRRRRKNKKVEMAEMINTAVAAATSKGPRQPDSAEKQTYAHAQVTPIPSKHYDSTPVYVPPGSGHNSPASMYHPQAQHAYANPSDATKGYELPTQAATPYQYPRPASPGRGMSSMYGGAHNAAEMQHPPQEMYYQVPVEAATYSPRPGHAGMHG